MDSKDVQQGHWTRHWQSDCLLSGSFVKLDKSRDKPENQELSVVNCAEVIP